MLSGIFDLVYVKNCEKLLINNSLGFVGGFSCPVMSGVDPFVR